MSIRLYKLLQAVLYMLLVVAAFPLTENSQAAAVSFEISSMQPNISENALTYTIKGSSTPIYTVSERFSPFRVVVDIAGASLSATVPVDAGKIPKNSFVSLTSSTLKEKKPQVMRFEFSLADTHNYTVDSQGKSLIVKVFPTATKPGGVAQIDSKAPANPSSEAIKLTDFQISSTPNATSITIVATKLIKDYTVDTIAGAADRNPRMFIDIPNVAINELIREKNIGTSVSKIRVADRGNGARIVFDSSRAQLFKYTVAPSSEGLSVVIDEAGMASGNKPAPSPAQAAQDAPSDATLDALIGSSEKLMNQPAEKNAKNALENKADALKNQFSFSGYNKKNITVDFYKIDIHNVFRLFRQITDLNIIVDEDVKGSLTLALTDVPWDFALDLIVNLMDLKKEERYNTIVVYPAKKEFAWPNRAEDNLSFKPDMEMIQKEALVIEKTSNLSKEIQEAQELIEQASKYEKLEQFEDACKFYDKASQLWPDNIAVTNRLSSIYLVNLRVNAKALFYAQKSLKINAQDTHAALFAAIAAANMQQTDKASDYFAQSISGNPPMKEALLSYASFSENHKQNDAALKLLDKYRVNFGDTIDTMVARARIYDKLGLTQKATAQYRTLLSSGFAIRPDLRKYIDSRLSQSASN